MTGMIERIESLEARLNGKEPKWLRGTEKRENHLSGALREMTDLMCNPDLSLDEIEMNIRELMDEAAEALDDAHEEWLNTQLAARDLTGDIEALKCDGPDPDMDGSTGWFGKFTEAHDDWDGFGLKIQWPNLEISQTQLAAVLRGEEYKL